MKELYDKVMEAYESKDENAFAAAARNWVEGAQEAPFEDSEARGLFSDAKRHCLIWRSGAISSRVSKLRMVACIRKIAEKNLPNPYKEIKKEKKHVLGVIPEEAPAVKDKSKTELHIFGRRKKARK